MGNNKAMTAGIFHVALHQRVALSIASPDFKAFIMKHITIPINLI